METDSASFTELPDDVHINILSFLTPSDISSVACTSRGFAPLPTSASLWFAMCQRRWGKFTSPSSWVPNHCTSRRLYHALDKWENLIGFWRRIGHSHGSTGAHATQHPLVFFGWNENSITGFSVSPCTEPGSHNVVKTPFISLDMSSDGLMVSYRWLLEDEVEMGLGLNSCLDPVPVSLSFVGPNHLVVEEGNQGFGSEEENLELQLGINGNSPPDQVTLEMYRYFANRTSPSGEKGSRKQKKKGKGKGKGKSLFKAEHLVKIGQYCPSESRPLQGVWKGISENKTLEFYLVSYDDIGGITCRLVSNSTSEFSGYSPLFWSDNSNFLIPPFPQEELDFYTSKEHINDTNFEEKLVSRILCIRSSYNMALPDIFEGHDGNSRDLEGRVWEYEDGSFGFGFVRDDYVFDLKRIAFEGRILDSVEN